MPAPDVQNIGKYEILAELGQGGFGRVYRAFDPTVGRPVAIKILTSEGNRDLLTRFRNEATAAGNLRHRNIVTVYDYGEHNGRPYLVMELLEGEDLTHIIADRKPLSLLQKMTIMDQIAAGLDCAHQHGVLHRDVKPANIRILPDGTVKIMDFGIARVNTDPNVPRLTQQGDLIGTILYMSPEQFSGSEADALCDIFAYGLIYFELLTGKHPFRSADPRTVMFKITMSDPEPLRSLEPGCPEGLEKILNRALHRDRELRYQTLRDLQLDTEPLIFELKQARASELAAEATEVSGAGDSRKALLLINEALNLDPSNRETRQLREDVQRRIQKEALQPRIDALLQSAHDQVTQRSFVKAVQSLEAALKLDETSERIRGELQSARDLMNRAKEAVDLMAAARHHLSRKEWLAASGKCREAEAIDPSNADLARAHEEIGRHVADVLARADAVMEQGGLLDAAVRELRELAVLQPESPEIQRRLTAAKARLETNEQIEAIIGNAREHIAYAKFDEALQEIATGLQSWPGDRRLTELLASAENARKAHERDLFVQRALLTCSELRQKDRFQDALEIVEKGLSQYPGETALSGLRAELQEKLDLQRRHAEARREIDGARQLLEQGRPADAVGKLEGAARHYPESEALRQLLTQAREALRRVQTIDRARAETERRVDQNDFAGAIRLLEEALTSYPENSELDRLLRATEAAHEKWLRQQALTAFKQRYDSLIQSNQLEQAQQEVLASLAKFPDEPVLVELNETLRALVEEQNRLRSVSEALAKGNDLLEQGQTARAVAVLMEACGRYSEQSLQDLLHQAQSALNELHRREEVEKALAEAKRRSDLKDFPEAIRVLERALDALPEDNAVLSEALQTVRAAQRDVERRIAVSKLAQECGVLAQRHSYAEALKIVDVGLTEYPGEAALLDLQRDLQIQLEEQRRAAAVRSATAEARRLTGREDFAAATATVQAALKTWSGEEQLKALLREVEDAQTHFERRRAVQELVQAATELARQNRFAEALSTVETGLRRFSGEPELLETEKRLRRQLEDEHRAAAVNEAGRNTQRHLEQGHPKEAVALLQGVSNQYPDEARLKQLLTSANEALQLKEKNEALERISTEARSRVDRKDFAGAVETLNSGLKSWPKERLLSDLLSDTRKAHQHWERHQAIDEVTRHAKALADANNLRGALKAVQVGVRKHGPDPLFLDLQAELEAQSAALKREAAARTQPPSTDQPVDTRPSVFSRKRLALAGVAAVVLLALPVTVRVLQRPRETALLFESNVSGATVAVGGKSCVTPNCELKLPVGDYRLAAVKDGFDPLEQNLSIKGNGRERKIPLVFTALPQLIQVNTNFDSGSVLVDGKTAGDLRDGQFSMNGVSSGVHTIHVTGKEGDFEASWRAEPGAPPKLIQPIAANNVRATLLSNVGRNGLLSCNCDLGKVAVDGNAVTTAADAADNAVILKNLTEGARRITVADRSLIADVRPNPSLNIFLSLDRNVGTLIVDTHQDNATIYLNNKPLRRATNRGSIRVPVDVGEYVVRAEKPGFQSSSTEKVAIGKGEEKQISLTLTPLPASLDIVGALPGALVRVDGRRLGETSENGTLRADVTPGDHQVEFLKPDYGPVRFGASFAPGQTVRPAREQIAMVRLPRTPVAPDPVQAEAQDWEKIRNSNSPEELDAFIRRHPGSANLDNARARITQLQQQAQLEAARQAEQNDWDSLDKTRAAALQDFLSRHRNSPHQQLARGLLAELQKREAEALSARVIVEPPKPVELKEKEPDVNARNAADQEAVTRALNQYEAAYNVKDLPSLERIWRGMPKSVSDALSAQFRYARTVAFQLRPSAAAIISGDTAVVVCLRRLDLTTTDNHKVNSGNERVEATLDRVGPNWVIRSFRTLP